MLYCVGCPKATVLSHHVNLRQVSQAVSKHTTQHLPYITMRLAEFSSVLLSNDQLQQWYQATRQLQHVTIVRPLVSSSVTAEIFHYAVELLLQQSVADTELQICWLVQLLIQQPLQANNDDNRCQEEDRIVAASEAHHSSITYSGNQRFSIHGW